MPAQRKPTALLHLAGSFKKDPKRAKAREDEPVVAEGIGEPPACFLPDANGYQSSEAKDLVELWSELISIAAPGVLNRSHRWHLEMTCRLMRRDRKGLANAGEKTALNKCLTQMGMNPAAQSTIRPSGYVPKDEGGGSTLSRLAAQAHEKTRAS